MSTKNIETIDIDSHVRSRLEQYYPTIKQQLTEIAEQATKTTNIDYTPYIDNAANSLYSQLLDYLLYGNPQINHLRKIYSKEENKIKVIAWIFPTTIAVDTLAILSGVTYNPKTGQPDRNILGQYINEGTISIGTLYTGAKTFRQYMTDYHKQLGYYPEIGYEWQHLRSFGKIFHPHLRLDGKIITNENWRTLLANLTEPWLGTPYFYPQDHRGCLCQLKLILLSI